MNLVLQAHKTHLDSFIIIIISKVSLLFVIFFPFPLLKGRKRAKAGYQPYFQWFLTEIMACHQLWICLDLWTSSL